MWKWIWENAEVLVNLSLLAGFVASCAIWYWRWGRPLLHRLFGTWDAIARIEKQLNELSVNVSLVQGVQRAMLSQSSKGYFETDAQGRVVFVNRYYLEFTGKQLADVLVNGWTGTIAFSDRARVVNEWQDSVKHDRDFDMTMRMVDAEGDEVSVRMQARRVKNSAGNTIAFAGTVLDRVPPGRAKNNGSHVGA